MYRALEQSLLPTLPLDEDFADADADASTSDDSSFEDCSSDCSLSSDYVIEKINSPKGDPKTEAALLAKTVLHERDPIKMDAMAEGLLDCLLEQLFSNIFFDICKTIKLNLTGSLADLNKHCPFVNDFADRTNGINGDSHKVVENGSFVRKDIYGNPIGNNQKVECLCPGCSRTIAASRLAPHLEKCMGKGRNSFRAARTRIKDQTSKILNTNGTGSD